MIAFLGTGLLGTGFVRALRARGEEVRVWNRTRARAEALAAEGAVVASSPADAVRGADRVHLCLSDDAAVDDVLAQAGDAIATGAWVVDHTTTTASGARDRTARWRGRGVRFLHAPVFMGPENALKANGLMLVSGDRALVAEARPWLEPMTGKVIDLGERVEAAASFKLLGNLFLMFLTSGFADLLGLAKALGVPPDQAVTLFSFFNPGMSIPARIGRVVEGDFDHPSWELAMARKDARLMVEEAARGGVDLAVLPAIAARMDELIAAGEGRRDWTVLAKDAL